MSVQQPFVQIRQFPDYIPGPDFRTYYDYTPSRIPEARAGAAYSGYGNYGVASGYVVADGGGYTFQLNADGSLTVIDAPIEGRVVDNMMVKKKWGVGTRYSPGDPAYETIVARLKIKDPGFEAALGGSSTGSSPDTSSKVNWASKIVQSFGLDTPQGQQAAGDFLATQGPDIASAVSSLFQSKGKSLPDLLKRLAAIRAKLPTVDNPARRAKLEAEAQGIQMEVAALQNLQASPALLPGGPLPEPSPFPFWVIPAGVLGLAALVGGFFLLRR